MMTELFTISEILSLILKAIVTALAGQNNVWADCGNVTVEYGAFLQALQQEIETIMGGG